VNIYVQVGAKMLLQTNTGVMKVLLSRFVGTASKVAKKFCMHENKFFYRFMPLIRTF
jgi:hypothetical protein